MAIFAAWVTYINHEERIKVRPTHRAYLAKLLAEGKLVASGPFTDETGALLVYQAENEAEVRQLMDADPNNSVGAFGEVTIREWNRVFAAETPLTQP